MIEKAPAQNVAIAGLLQQVAEGLESEDLDRERRIKDARAAAKRKDVLAWGKALFPEKFGLPFCKEMHGYFVATRGEEFTGEEAPRNHSKTTIRCFLIPIFQALEEPQTFRHYLNVQATGEKAHAINVAIRTEIENNLELREIYGDLRGMDRWTDKQFVLKTGIIFTAIGAGQSMRGINYHNVRPDYINVDDLYDEDDINNPDATSKKNKWFWSSLFLARAKSKRSSIHVLGTAINSEDLLEELKGKKRWKCKTFKAIKDEAKKTVLWPELNSYDALMADKADTGTVIFEREMQNERRDDASSIIKRSWLSDWLYDPDELAHEMSQGNFTIVEAAIGQDPSIGKNAESDSTGTALIYKARYMDSKGHVFFIAGLWNELLSMDKRIALTRRVGAIEFEGHPVNRVKIESISGFNDYAQQVVSRTDLPVQRVTAVKDKITNLENKSHWFENGKVFLSKNISKHLRDTLVNQLTTNHPKHDDLRDAVLLVLPGVEKKSKWGPA